MPREGGVFAGRFQIDATIGQGGFGIVYRARNLRTGQRCALKVLTPEALFDDDARAHFLEEARRTPSDRSEHVVRVYDADVSDGVPWLSMELLDGCTLGAWIAARGPMSHSEFARFFRELCHGVGAAHERGIVHRDLKPENVFLHQRADVGVGGRWMVKVLDFGVAKALAARSPAASIAVRTHGWGAPEQAVVGRVSPAADVWALGLLAYYALTGRGYFGEVALGEVVVPASVRARAQGVEHCLPPGFDAWFARCVAWDPQARFGDALAALEAFPAIPRSVPPVAAPRARHGRWALGLVALTAGLVAAGWWAGPRVPSLPSLPSLPSGDPPPASLGRPLSDDPALHEFAQRWLRAISNPPVTRARMREFYAESFRFNNATCGDRWIADYWQSFFTRNSGSFEFHPTWASTVIEERLAAGSSAARECGTEVPVTLLRLAMTQHEPGRASRTGGAVPCARLEGVYLLRLKPTAAGPRICHETWSLREGICASCPRAPVCAAESSRGTGP